MSTFKGRGLHGQVVNELGTRIMRGELPPGTLLDPDGLAHEMEVSRTVMREALKVLTAKGFIDARPRVGTSITDRSHWQLLDAEVMSWRAAGRPDPRLVLELDEVRLVIEPAAARMAALRHTKEQAERLRVAIDELERSYKSDDPGRPDHAIADVDFHRAVLAASGNELLERFEVVLAPALQARDKLTHGHMTSLDFLDDHRAVYDAIIARDPALAEQRMLALMRLSAVDSAVALGMRDE